MSLLLLEAPSFLLANFRRACFMFTESVKHIEQGSIRIMCPIKRVLPSEVARIVRIQECVLSFEPSTLRGTGELFLTEAVSPKQSVEHIEKLDSGENAEEILAKL